MKQKVITVVFSGLVDSGKFNQFDFPKLQSALDEGFAIKQTIANTSHVGYATGASNQALTFILEKE